MEFRTRGAGPGRGAAHRRSRPAHRVRVARSPTWYDRAAVRGRARRPGHRPRVRRVRHRPACRRGSDDDELEAALADLAGERLTRPTAARTADLARRIAACSYEVEFPPETALAERVLWPQSPSESHGIEDARFVRVEDDGVYRATYTAFDGASIAPQLIETADFRRFRMSQLAGPAAQNKGMALFPRRVGGRYVALSRWDRENNALATSADGVWWDDRRHAADAEPSVGAAPARELRFADRDRGRLDRADARGRADARVRHRRAAAGPGRPEPRDRRAARPAPGAGATTSATATCPTSSTPAGRCGTATSCCCPTGPATRRSGSPSSTSRCSSSG